MREVLKNMNEEDGTTILISSHILPELHQLATVYGFIHHGKMLQQITDKELDETLLSCSYRSRQCGKRLVAF